MQYRILAASVAAAGLAQVSGLTTTDAVVAIVVYDGVGLFELAAANDVFGTDITTASGERLYEVLICGPAASVMTEAGFRMEVTRGLDALDEAQTVVVLPTLFPEKVPPEVLEALRRARSRWLSCSDVRSCR